MNLPLDLIVFQLKYIKEMILNFLGIVSLTREQRKRLDQMNKDYEETFGQKGGPKNAVRAPNVLNLKNRD
jgi:hypothetical protein